MNPKVFKVYMSMVTAQYVPFSVQPLPNYSWGLPPLYHPLHHPLSYTKASVHNLESTTSRDPCSILCSGSQGPGINEFIGSKIAERKRDELAASEGPKLSMKKR